MELSKEQIDNLFENEYFKEKLNSYIVSNIEVSQEYDCYFGTADPIKIKIAGVEIETKVIPYNEEWIDKMLES